MQVAARPYLAAGVALVGASAIAIGPIAPQLPDIQVPAISSANVELSALADQLALPDPITPWAEVLGAAFANIGDLGTAVLANPAPALRQLIDNQLGNAVTITGGLQGTVTGLIDQLSPDNPNGFTAQLQVALGQIGEGDFTGATETFKNAVLGLVLAPVGSLLPLLSLPSTMAQNFANVVAVVPDLALPIGLGAISSVLGTMTAAGDSAQAVYDAASTGDAAGAFDALINTPATVTGALLNGYEGGYIGLLTTGDLTFSRGLVQSLLQTIPEAIAAAIAPAEAKTNALSGLAGLLGPKAEATEDGATDAATTVTLKVAADATKAPKPALTTDGAKTPVSAPASAATDETPAAAAESETTDTATDADTKADLVKDSLKAEPGKTATSPKTARTNPLKQVRDGIQGTVKNVSDGFKKAAEGLSGKPGKHAKPAGSSSSSTGSAGESSSSGSTSKAGSTKKSDSSSSGKSSNAA